MERRESPMRRRLIPLLATAMTVTLAASAADAAPPAAASKPAPARSPEGRGYLSQPLVTQIFTADPSAHVFGGKIYVYPSHDVDAGIPDDDLGSEYAMHDYRILRMDKPGGPVTIGPVALDVKQVPWADKQMWAPDVALKNGTYYLYFPARDPQGVFRLGVATSKNPMGPFKAEPKPIPGSFSIDPAAFTDGDGATYLTFGGIWGGQLQRWATGRFDPAGSDTDLHKDDQPALAPKIARLSADMKSFAEPIRDIRIVDPAGKPILAGDHDRRFFEAPWIFKRNGTYYFLYSTGDTHFLAYATGKSPYGPFTYRGHVMEPVQGWTTHGSITPIGDRWYLFYHDTQISNRNSLRNVKMTELRFAPDGSIRPIDPFTK
jgi:hypothetical protein